VTGVLVTIWGPLEIDSVVGSGDKQISSWAALPLLQKVRMYPPNDITPHTKIKVKGKVHPTIGHEGPEGEYRY